MKRGEVKRVEQHINGRTRIKMKRTGGKKKIIIIMKDKKNIGKIKKKK